MRLRTSCADPTWLQGAHLCGRGLDLAHRDAAGRAVHQQPHHNAGHTARRVLVVLRVHRHVQLLLLKLKAELAESRPEEACIVLFRIFIWHRRHCRRRRWGTPRRGRGRLLEDTFKIAVVADLACGKAIGGGVRGGQRGARRGAAALIPRLLAKRVAQLYLVKVWDVGDRLREDFVGRAGWLPCLLAKHTAQLDLVKVSDVGDRLWEDLFGGAGWLPRLLAKHVAQLDPVKVWNVGDRQGKESNMPIFTHDVQSRDLHT
eukprot:361198-Chlamydomonas_euryale.AAC.2